MLANRGILSYIKIDNINDKQISIEEAAEYLAIKPVTLRR